MIFITLLSATPESGRAAVQMPAGVTVQQQHRISPERPVEHLVMELKTAEISEKAASRPNSTAPAARIDIPSTIASSRARPPVGFLADKAASHWLLRTCLTCAWGFCNIALLLSNRWAPATARPFTPALPLS